MAPLGFLYPGYAAEDDYPRMAGILGVEVDVVHTGMGEDAHRTDALLEIGSPERLQPGAEELRSRGAEVVLWACTSGSFVFGWEGARKQVEDLADRVGLPVSSTSWAFAEALTALGIGRVAIAATYPADVAGLFADFLGRAGVEAVSVGAEDIITAAEVGTLGREAVLSFVSTGDHPKADAILVPDTALHTVEWLDELEESLRKPVLTANQVTMWEALRLAGRPTAAPRLGHLFAA